MKKIIALFTLLTLLLLPFACGTTKSLSDYRLLMDRNVCKKMRGDVLFYAIFVDTKSTKTFSEDDVRNCVDTLSYAAKWLEAQAKIAYIPLKIKVSFMKNIRAIPKDLPYKTLKETMASIDPEAGGNGITNINKWADDVCKLAGAKMDNKSNPGDTLPIISNPKGTDRLIAKLRDEYKVESVCLFFILNSMAKEDGAIVMNIGSNTDIEYVITSYNTASMYAFCAMEEFGAIDFFSMEQSSANAKLAQTNFASDVMVNPFKKLSALKVSPFTQYMIGWTNYVDKQYEPLFYPSKASSSNINMR